MQTLAKIGTICQEHCVAFCATHYAYPCIACQEIPLYSPAIAQEWADKPSAPQTHKSTTNPSRGAQQAPRKQKKQSKSHAQEKYVYKRRSSKPQRRWLKIIRCEDVLRRYHSGNSCRQTYANEGMDSPLPYCDVRGPPHKQR